MNQYKDMVAKATELLKSNPEWEDRYAGYAKRIKAKESDYKNGWHKFHVNTPIYRYTTVSTVISGKRDYDLRFCGQSIATVTVKDGEVFVSTGEKSKSNKEHFGVTTTLENERWAGEKASEFRAAFTPGLQQENLGRSPEHRVENQLLAEFSKTKASDKLLCNIQPVKLCGLFFQMPTPLKASTDPITYANGRGGGIDILARVTHKKTPGSPKKTNLCVMELKDENIANEPPEKVMKQAIAYATFLAHLLRSKSGNEWYKIFGYKGNVPAPLTIDVAVVMPGRSRQCNTHFGEKLEVQGLKDTNLQLLSLYIETRYVFTDGSLLDIIEPCPKPPFAHPLP